MVNLCAQSPVPRQRAVFLGGVLLLLMAGCPGQQQPPANNPPVANAGMDQTVDAGASVTLDGSASSDPDGDTISFSWKQTLGTPVALSSTTAPVVTITAPSANIVLGFELTVSDGQSQSTATAGVALRLADASESVEERIQRSVTDDPNVLGNFPSDWLIPDAGVGLPGPPSTEDPLTGDEPELPEFEENFRDARIPEVVQEPLAPGATRTVTIDIDAPSRLAGHAQWLGTTQPMDVSIALNGAPLAVGGAYQMGHDRGGTYVTAETTSGGTASFSVTNTTDVTVTLRLIFGAHDLDVKPE